MKRNDDRRTPHEEAPGPGQLPTDRAEQRESATSETAAATHWRRLRALVELDVLEDMLERKQTPLQAAVAPGAGREIEILEWMDRLQHGEDLAGELEELSRRALEAAGGELDKLARARAELHEFVRGRTRR